MPMRLNEWFLGVAAATPHRIEVQQQSAIIERIEKDLELRVTRLAPGRQLGEILQSVPSDADRVALDDHFGQINRLEERLQGHRQRADDLDQALNSETEQLPVVADPTARQALSTAIREAQSLGDVARQRTDLDRQIRELERQLQIALLDLATESEQALRHTHPILEAQITITKQELTDVEEQLRKASDEHQLVGRDLDGQQLRHRQLAAEGEVVTAETLRHARMRRDEGWALIRHAYIERTQNADELARSFDADRALPEAFETAESEADRQADLLRADAKRAAGFEECSVRIEQMEARRKEIESQMIALSIRRGNLLSLWAQRLSQAGLPHLDPDTLREWQAKRHGALQQAERLAVLRADRDRMLSQVAVAASNSIASGS